MVLPKDGSWVDFVVAGKFPRASSADKDAIIEVHRATADGPVVLRHPLMIRIRKDHRKLTDDERLEFLKALRYLRWTAKTPDGKGLYREFVRLHSVAAYGGVVSPAIFPDLAHKGPSFVAWHRAFLLQFERAIQEKFPHVTLPYWMMNEESTLFTRIFLGANPVLPGNQVVEAEFDPVDNPLHGWSIDLASLPRHAITRSGAILSTLFDSDASLFNRTTYSNYPDRATLTTGFVDALESNPHNRGHGWVGPWMGSCQTSPRDPIFWIFHAGFDRQWASWQYKHNRLAHDGSNGSYYPLGDFHSQGASAAKCNVLTPNVCTPIGHNAEDTMWPWNDLWGPQATLKGSWPPRNTLGFKPFFLNFREAPISGLWPARPAKPRPVDMIDYAGLAPSRADMGFAYDTVPYGAPPAPASPGPVASIETVEKSRELMADFSDPKKNFQVRVTAAERLNPDLLADSGQIKLLLDLLRSKEEPERIRSDALGHLQRTPAKNWVGLALEVLNSPPTDDGKLTVEIIGALTRSAMFTADGREFMKEIFSEIRKSLKDPRPAVRSAAIQATTPMGDPATLEILAEALNKPDDSPITASEAIQGIRISGKMSSYQDVVRPYLASANPAVRLQAVKTLVGDEAAEADIAAIINGKDHGEDLRRAAVAAVAGSSAGGPILKATKLLLLDDLENPELRVEAAAMLGLYLEANADALPSDVVDEIAAAFASAATASNERVRTLAERGQRTAGDILAKQ